MISATVNTYNEERNLDRCLSSITSWVDEIVIIDMGSTDDTIKKAKQYTDKIFHHPYTGFVEPARNFAIEKTKGEWILLIDADEEIPKELKTIINSLIKNSTKSFFRMPRKNIIFGKWIRHAYWWPDYQIRLFKKGSVVWSDKIHSVPLTRGEGFDLDPDEKNAIIHYNYQTIGQFVTRLNQYSNIQAKELYIAGRKFSWTDLIRYPTQEFLSRFFEGQGYKDGLHGLSLSLLQAVSTLILYAKLWELEGFTEEKIKIGELQNELKERNRQENYWFIEERLKPHTPFLSKLRLKVERKFNP